MVMKQPKSPCNGCSTREPACHDTCEEFLAYRNEYIKYKKLVDLARNREHGMDKFKIERAEYSKKMAGR